MQDSEGSLIPGVDFAEVERTHVRRNLFADFAWVANDRFSTVNPLRVPLVEARVAFVTTAGAHLASQAPFDIDAKAGDPSYRAFAHETPLTDVVLTHGGYNTERASRDRNVVLPLDHLQALVREGRIGEVAPTIYSTMGYVADVEPFQRDTAPEIAQRLVDDRADLVLLAPT